MVKTLNPVYDSHHTLTMRSPLVVELVGLAGAGKTTLLRALCQLDQHIRVTDDLELRNMNHIPTFVAGVPFMLSLALRGNQANRGFTWDEIKSMLYLKNGPSILGPTARQHPTTVLLNHGPIFKLATLDAFGPQSLKSQAFEQWWHSIFEQWASALDIIVWLSAPSDVLIERINMRAQRHAVKGKSELEARRFLARYEKAYEQTLAKLTACGGPAPLHIDSSQATVEQIVDRVLLTCRVMLGRS